MNSLLHQAIARRIAAGGMWAPVPGKEKDGKRVIRFRYAENLRATLRQLQAI